MEIINNILIAIVASLLIGSCAKCAYEGEQINKQVYKNSACFEQTKDKSCWDLK